MKRKLLYKDVADQIKFEPNDPTERLLWRAYLKWWTPDRSSVVNGFVAVRSKWNEVCKFAREIYDGFIKLHMI
jgi:hypothetical protein